MGLCGPTHDERSWTFDLDPGGVDPVLGFERVQQAYFARFPDYSRGITVPAVVEIGTRQLVTNDPKQLTLDLSTEWTAFHRDGAPDLYPEPLRGEIDEVAELIYADVNDGSTDAGSPARTLVRAGLRPPSSPGWTGSAIGSPDSGIWSGTRSPRRTSGCSPRSPGSTPSITVTSRPTGTSSQS
jgi:hypothetical protein